MRHAATRLALVAVALCPAACQFERDEILAGYYGPESSMDGTVASGSSSPGTQSPASTEPSTPTTDSSNAASSQSGGSGAGSAGTNGQEDASGQDAPPAGTAGVSTDNGASAMDGGGAGGCDLTGAWLVTQHVVTDALGQLQYAHDFMFYEIEQQGDTFTVTRGLICGTDAIGTGLFAVTADFKSTWPVIIERIDHAGRTGSSKDNGSGCDVQLDEYVNVKGATQATYRDRSVALPTAEQQAVGDSPGWEDWDGDGNPGITGVVSGAVDGKIFVAPRQWTTMSGAVADTSTRFKLAVDWGQEPNVMAFDGSPLLSSTAERAFDDALHFTEFARLDEAQASGDPTAICQRVVDLAPTLTPEAAGN